jgi:ribosomal RNA-processing protein 12
LAALTEVIKEQGGEETSTEYFAALLTTLEATDTEEGLSAIVSLLSMVIKTVPQEIIRSRFSKVRPDRKCPSFGGKFKPFVS